MPVAKGVGEGGGASRLGFGGVGGGVGFLRGGFHDPIRVDCMEGQVWVCVWTFCTYKTLLEVSIPYSTTTTPAYTVTEKVHCKKMLAIIPGQGEFGQ